MAAAWVLGATATLTGMLGYVRRRMVDTDATDPALDDTSLIQLVNRVYSRWAEQVSPRFQYLASNVSGFGDAYNLFTVTSTLTTIAEIKSLGLNLNSTAAAATLPSGGTQNAALDDWLERDELNAVQRSLLGELNGGQATDGRAVRWAAERVQTQTSNDVDKWKLWFNQQLSGTPLVGTKTNAFVVIHARLDAATLANAADPLDISLEDGYVLGDYAAAYACHSIGEDPEFVQELLQAVPRETQEALALIAVAEAGPRLRPGERGTE